jgi:hypothetical protein
MHGVPAAHAMSQVPQLAVLVMRSTHVPSHAVWPLGHAAVHAPLTQDCPGLHAAPQAPQSFGFVMVSAHSTPPFASHGWKGQLAEQAPLTQYWPLGQALPQLPQFWASLTTVLQTPPQRACPPPHCVWQVPAWHVVPGPHELVQLPQ